MYKPLAPAAFAAAFCTGVSAQGLLPSESHSSSLGQISSSEASTIVQELRDYLPRIIGGQPAAPAEFPHQVSLLFDGDGSAVDRHFCGGSIVGDEWILTAAHCVSWTVGSTSFIRVGAGSNDLEELTEYEIGGVWIHPYYNADTFDYDFAILQTVRPLFNKEVKVVDAESNQSIQVGDPAIITGWGVNENGEIQQILRKAQVDVISRADCNDEDSYDGMISARMICLGYEDGGIDACQGDSGGPATVMLDGESEPTLIGATSWGFGCAEPEKFGVYSRVVAVAHWIESITN